MPRLLFNPFTGNFDYVARPQDKLRQGVVPTGSINGTNVLFTTPEKFVYISGKVEPAVYFNGQRLRIGAFNDFTVAESGGLGTGYDTLILAEPPRSSGATVDQLLVDYVMR